MFLGYQYHIYVTVFGALLGFFMPEVNSLDCWKCFGTGCENLKEESIATKVTCTPGHSCLKVYYTMGEVNSSLVYESVVRSCSSSPCQESSVSDLSQCINNPKQYNVLGCSLRKCCDDKHLCNSACQGHISGTAMFVLLITVCLTDF